MQPETGHKSCLCFAAAAMQQLHLPPASLSYACPSTGTATHAFPYGQHCYTYPPLMGGTKTELLLMNCTEETTRRLTYELRVASGLLSKQKSRAFLFQKQAEDHPTCTKKACSHTTSLN